MLIFLANDVLAVIQEATQYQCKLLFVKDHGVYLMSAKGEYSDNLKRRKNIAYAKNCNPDTDDGWYDYAVIQVGGDDFVIEMDYSDKLFQLMAEHKCDLKIKDLGNGRFEMKL